MINYKRNSRRRIDGIRYRRIMKDLRSMGLSENQIKEFWNDCHEEVKRNPETNATAKHRRRRFRNYMWGELRKLGIKQELNID